MAKFYLESGMRINNITKFIQFQPAKILEGFANHVTRMRIAAEYEKQPTKSLTAKIFGNSGYGKVSLPYLTSVCQLICYS